MPGRPRDRALTSASGSINSARAVLTKIAVGFMRERSDSRTTWRVLSASRRCSDSTSLAAKNVSRSGAAV